MITRREIREKITKQAKNNIKKVNNILKKLKLM